MYYGLLGLASKKGTSYGTLTTAWIAATGETDLTILGALNTLESDLTTYGLTSKMKALYPMVGGTAAKHKFNFMDAQDTDAAYRLVFNGGWTHSSTGALPNGTNAFADTKLNASTVLASFNSNHISYYSRTQNLTDSANMGGGSGSAYLTLERSTQWNGNTFLNFAIDPTTSLFINTRTANNVQKLYRNGSQLGSTNTTTITTSANAALYLGARNIGGGNQYSVRECALASIGDGLNDTEASNFYTAVQTFQTTLGRQVGVPIVSDSDAQAFLNAAVITDTTQATAVNNLVIGLKADSLWTKMAAIYPMVGGTATAHSYNLKNTAANQITWSGGLTHSSTGVLPNGVNGLGDLNYILATSVSTLTPQNNHISFYSRTDNSSGYDIYGTAATNQLGIIAKYTPNGKAYYIVDGTYSPNVANANGNGFYLGAANSSSTTKLFRNGSSIVTGSTTQTSFGGSTGNIKLFTGDGTYGSKECAFASVGTGLSDTDAANFYTRVQTYQTALSRNV